MRRRRSNPPPSPMVPGAASIEISCHGGDRDHPIPVDRFSGRGVDLNHPLPLEDDDEEEVGDSIAGIFRGGGDRNHPISVEDYHDVLPQTAIADSLRHRSPPPVIGLHGFERVKQETSDQRGKRPVKEISFIDLDGFEARENGPYDPRGRGTAELPRRISKRSRHEENSVAEFGESSTLTPTEPNTFCPICADDKFDFEMFSIKGCSHVYCKRCVSRYVAGKVAENQAAIRCLHPVCKTGFLELEICRSILPPKVIDRWGIRLCEALLEPMRLYCPYKDCSAFLIDEGRITGEVIRITECPHCSRLFCVQCKVPWHSGMTCEAYQQLGERERESEDLSLKETAKRKNWQRCPNCKFYVEKIDGCNFVKCRCGLGFCYKCASPMDEDSYCIKCHF